MGFYADSSWDIKITGDINELAAEIKKRGYNEGWLDSEEHESVDFVINALRNCNEDTDFDTFEDDTVIRGWGGGKMLSLASDNDFLGLLARYCVGTSDWKSDEGYWRVRFYGDGKFSEFPGDVRYPDDPDDEKGWEKA